MHPYLTYSNPNLITVKRESIINFEKDCIVSFGERIGTVMRKDGKHMIIQFTGSIYTESIYYSFLKIVEYKKKLDPKRKWTDKEVTLLLENIHLSNGSLRLLIGRTEDSISMYKNQHGLNKTTI